MMMKFTGVAVLFAELDIPSFSAFPLLGLVVWVVFAALMAAGIAAAVWMDRENQKLAIPQMEWWYFGIGAVLAALLVGTMELGPLMIPAVAVGLPVFLAGFTKQRDKRVPSAQRLLTKNGVGNLLRGLKDSSNKKKAAAAKLAALKPKAPAKSFADRLKGAGGSVMNVLRKKKEEKKEEPNFKLLKKDGSAALAEQEDGDDSGNLSENVRHLQEMMIAAMKAGATDIHFEPHEKEYFVRFRVDGVLQNSSTMPIGEGKGVISAFKVVSDMDISERRRPQDGTFSAIFEGTKYDIRSASTPTSYGEKMVMRVLQSSGGMLTGGRVLHHLKHRRHRGGGPR